MAETGNYQLNQWESADRIQMEDFNADNAKIDAALTAAGNCRIVSGSYTGTGTYGETHPNSLTFERPPLVVFLTDGSLQYCALRNSDIAFCEGASGYTVYLTWEGNTLRWYSPGSAIYQLNYSDAPYYYVALLGSDE